MALFRKKANPLYELFKDAMEGKITSQNLVEVLLGREEFRRALSQEELHQALGLLYRPGMSSSEVRSAVELVKEIEPEHEVVDRFIEKLVGPKGTQMSDYFDSLLVEGLMIQRTGGKPWEHPSHGDWHENSREVVQRAADAVKITRSDKARSE